MRLDGGTDGRKSDEEKVQLACQAAAANQVWQTGTGMSGTLPVSVVSLYLVFVLSP